jgi:tetratricopeptide (TPR) repeat protein
VDFSSSEGDIRIRYGKYAELLVTISPILWAVAIYTRNRRQMLFILMVALASWITVMLSLSKGAFIAGIVGFVIFFIGSAVFSARYFRKRVAAFAAIWLVLTIGTQVFFSFFSAVPSTTSYITGAADTTRSTSTMRIFTWRVAKQMAADHWLTGVGADNFGLAFNQARVRFREAHPNDTSEEIAEDYIVERAHNEPLQVLSELGVIGLLLLSLVFVFFAVFCVKNYLTSRRSSPMMWAALAGMAAFVVSSQFSSFSFRSAQNGVVFFMVLAVAVIKMPKADRKDQTISRQLTFSRSVYVFSWIAALLLTAFCLTKVNAEYQAFKAERAETYSDAADHFRLALAADPGYAGAFLSGAARASKEGDPALAASMTKKAIENGVGMTPVYSQLAKQYVASGDLGNGESTYREALSIYPRSIFIRTEFAVFFEKQNRPTEAAEQIAMARSIDLRQANGWYLMISEGGVTAFYRSQNDPNVAPPAELTPYAAVRQYVDKIPEILHAE